MCIQSLGQFYRDANLSPYWPIYRDGSSMNFPHPKSAERTRKKVITSKSCPPGALE